MMLEQIFFAIFMGVNMENGVVTYRVMPTK